MPSAAAGRSLNQPRTRERREDREGGADHLLGPAAEPGYVLGQEQRARLWAVGSSEASSAAIDGSSASQTSPNRGDRISGPSVRRRRARSEGDGESARACAFAWAILRAPPSTYPCGSRSALRTAPARAEGRLQPGIESRRTEMSVESADPLGVQLEDSVSICHSHHRLNSFSGGKLGTQRKAQQWEILGNSSETANSV